jgi:hypothetical protein
VQGGKSVKGSRINYGRGAELVRATMRLTPEEREALLRIGKREGADPRASWMDLVRIAIKAASQ